MEHSPRCRRPPWIPPRLPKVPRRPQGPPNAQKRRAERGPGKVRKKMEKGRRKGRRIGGGKVVGELGEKIKNG